MFDFPKYVNDYNIPIPDTSKNTGRNWINIQCPFCNDQKNHLGFNTTNNYFHCWKCPDPGFHKIEDVIKKLTPFENIEYILKKYDSYQIYESRIIKKLKKEKVKKIKLPGEKLKLIHKNYLIKRKYNVTSLEQKYKLLGTTHVGKYKYRLVIPIYFDNQLVTFQTRALRKSSSRYINCDPENEVKAIKHIIYNIDNCKRNYCVLTEGVFKVFRLGDNSCAALGKNYTKIQLNILAERFKKVYVFFDPDKYGQDKAIKICNELHNLGVETYNIVNDLAPDDMAQKDADELMKIIYK